MNTNCFFDGWDRLRGVYGSMPDIKEQVRSGNKFLYEEWINCFKWCPDEVWLEAVSSYIRSEQYKPVPAKLLDYAYKAHKTWKAEQRKKSASLGATVCPWCGGSGYIHQIAAYPTGVDATYPCICDKSSDPAIGEMILAQAQSDSNWRFDKELFAFVRRREWIGEDYDADAVQVAFENNEVASLFGGV